MNVKRQLDEMKTFQSHHSPGQSTQEVSSDRTRAMSMDDAARVLVFYSNVCKLCCAFIVSPLSNAIVTYVLCGKIKKIKVERIIG